MKYCLNGTLVEGKIAERADEIIFDIPLDYSLQYFVEKYNIEQLAEDYKNKIIILNGINIIDLGYVNTVVENSPNVWLSTRTITDLEHFKDFISTNQIKNIFTIEEIQDLATFNFLEDIGIKRFVISGDLGFYLKFLKEKDNIIMVNPCQVIKGEKINSFFIRPEDIEYYSQFIDVIIFPQTFENARRQISLYNIYNKEKPWYGEMKELVIGLDSTYNNKYFVGNTNKKDIELINKTFRDIRCCCGAKCRDGGLLKCNLCFLMERLSNMIKKLEDKRIAELEK